MVLAQGGLVSMGLVDTWMIGRVSAIDMGAVALGHSVILMVVILGLGLSMGLEPLISQAFGAGEDRRARAWMWQGLWTALVVWLPTVAVVFLIISQLEAFGVEAALVTPVWGYVLARTPGMLFNLMQAAFRSYLSSVGRTRPVFFAVLAANVLNIGLNSFFLFHLKLGALGVGLSTTGSWGLMLLITGAAAIGGRRPRPAWPRLDALRRQVKVGLPIGLHMAAEVGMFSVVSLLIARLGPTALAANQIAQTLAGLTFMASTGVAVAGSARVGQLVGAGRGDQARGVGLLTVGVGIAIMVTGAAGYVSFAEPIVRSFVPKNPEVVPVGVALLHVVAFSAVSDGAQAAGAGILRGYGDTRWPFFAAVVGYWAVGLPVGIWLAGPVGWGATGYWGGLFAGLTTVGAALFVRFLWLSARPVARVEGS